MSSYHPEVELSSSTLSISLYPDSGVRLESLNISRRGGKPKSKQAIVVEFRVSPVENIAPSKLDITIPWKKGDPSKVEVQVIEVFEVEQEPMTFDLRKKNNSASKSRSRSIGMDSGDKKPKDLTGHLKPILDDNFTNSRGLAPVGGGKPKDMTGHQKPILDDE